MSLMTEINCIVHNCFMLNFSETSYHRQIMLSWCGCIMHINSMKYRCNELVIQICNWRFHFHTDEGREGAYGQI